MLGGGLLATDNPQAIGGVLDDVSQRRLALSARHVFQQAGHNGGGNVSAHVVSPFVQSPYASDIGRQSVSAIYFALTRIKAASMVEP